MGQFSEALQWYNLSLAEDSHDADTHFAVGFIYHLLRRYAILILI
jgi:hypothetical protein